MLLAVGWQAGDWSAHLRCARSSHQPLAGSSEALLSGQRPPFALLVRALCGGEGAAAGERAEGIPPVVSEGFVVSGVWGAVLAGWLAGWLVGWLAGWLAGWLNCSIQ